MNAIAKSMMIMVVITAITVVRKSVDVADIGFGDCDSSCELVVWAVGDGVKLELWGDVDVGVVSGVEDGFGEGVFGGVF